MRYFELKVTVILQRELTRKKTHYEMSRVINQSFLDDPAMKAIHEINTFKYYVFSELYPIPKQGYQAGGQYNFVVRSMDRMFLEKLRNGIRYFHNDLFIIIRTSFRSVEQSLPILTLYTETPAIAIFKLDNGRTVHWQRDLSPFDDIVFRINQNAKKKYENFFGESLSNYIGFVDKVVQANERVIISEYKKNSHLLGNKFRLFIKEDPLSQSLAFMTLGAGLLEKNSLGFGYCIPNQ